ncbi:50S ribosomal protein L19-1, chloroplastic-like [Actinidia eriantha]|uniref:50S ribosomal protein L19-1, chloroplastic-like n=1 Tax=Actinidia eriantha TaxID=165200 RepID=UPI002582E149|nr:50S ribosomal protein L19-1, chloroplastic-like [Actinidia eriantha]
MASTTVLLQALFTIPRNPTQCRPQTLGFYSFVSLRPSSFDSARVSISLVAINAFGPISSPVIPKLSNRSFVVRAESNSAEGEAEDTETVEDNEEEAESELEAEEKPPRKPRVKLGDIMGILNKRAIEASDQERPIPDLRTGDIVEIRMASLRKKRRLSRYKGIVISKQNAGIHTTIRIRRIIAGIGVEIVFPVYSPNIKEIKVVSHRKVRRARLYYLRDKLPRFSTFKFLKP